MKTIAIDTDNELQCAEHVTAQAHESPASSTSDSTVPDGGYGWVVTVAAAVIYAHSWGFNSAYAVFLAHYLKDGTFANATRLQYAFVGSLSLTAAMTVSPVATFAVQRFGIKAPMLAGVILEAASLFCASAANEFWQLALSQGILFGVGMGLLFIPPAALVPQWFTTKRSLASGVSLAGAGLGGFAYSLATGSMIRDIGLRNTLRVLGALALAVNGICVFLIKDRKQSATPHSKIFNFGLLKNKGFLLLIGWGFFTMLGYFVLIFSLANYANEIGLTSSDAAMISALFNLAQSVGRPIIGYYSDTLGRINMAGITTFLAGILPFAMWITAKNHTVLLCFSILEGLVAGNFWATVGPLVAEVLGIKDVASGMNLMWLGIVLPSTFSEPIALEIFIRTRTYLGTQLFTGFSYLAATLCLFFLRIRN